MLNCLPIVGWLISFLFATFLSVPFWFLWNILAPTYFYWLPPVYLHLPFWDVVGLVMLMSMIDTIMPKFVSSSSSSNSSKKD
jgi:hypothetical protein